MSLFGVYFTKALNEIQALQKKLLEDGVKLTAHDFASWKVGAVQTAYANGASTYFLKNNLGLDVKIVPTGVKHLHAAAHHFDIGIYFEANGHGTLLYKGSRMLELENYLTNLRSFDVMGLVETHKETYKKLENVANQMMLLLKLSNQVLKTYYIYLKTYYIYKLLFIFKCFIHSLYINLGSGGRASSFLHDRSHFNGFKYGTRGLGEVLH